MGVYLVYGILFSTGPDSCAELRWLLDIAVPDLVEKYGNDAWKHLDARPHAADYYLLNFPETKKLVLCCWWTSHSTSIPSASPPIEIPTGYSIGKFQEWCTNRNIDTEDIGLYILTSSKEL